MSRTVERRDVCSAVCCSVCVPAGGSRDLEFALAWHMPVVQFGAREVRYRRYEFTAAWLLAACCFCNAFSRLAQLLYCVGIWSHYVICCTCLLYLEPDLQYMSPAVCVCVCVCSARAILES